MTEPATYRVLLLGDFSYGESYPGGGAKILAEEGYEYSTKNLLPFIDSCDYFILNLETPLATQEEFPSPFAEQRPWIHWADPNGTGNALRDLKVDAVSLANNHAYDLGHPGLKETFYNLDRFNIKRFGAGLTRDDAERPLIIDLPPHVGGGQLAFYGAMQARRDYRELGFYATSNESGTAKVSPSRTPRLSASGQNEDTLHVAYPHWGGNYKWKNSKQRNIAQKLTDNGYDLVLGHGAHTIQEIEEIAGRPVVYSIGNGNFQSQGRWRKYSAEFGVMPFGFWSVLEVATDEHGVRRVFLNLYPVRTDNRKNNFQPSVVNEEEFKEIISQLSQRSSPSELSLLDEGRTAQDHLGHYIHIPVSTWEEGKKPVPTMPATGVKQSRNHIPKTEPSSSRDKSLSTNKITKRQHNASLPNNDQNARKPSGLSSFLRKLSRHIGKKTLDSGATERPKGVSPAELTSTLGGYWTSEVDPSIRILGGSCNLGNIPNSSALFVMDKPTWSTGRLKKYRQFERTPEQVVSRGAKRGAQVAISASPIPNSQLPVHVVPNARTALFDLAKSARAQFEGPVIGITGTVGKSSTTSLLEAALSKDHNVLRTLDTGNTIDSVAGTISELLTEPDIALIEAAISGFYRLAHQSAAEIIRPNLAIITAIGIAHADIAPTYADTARLKGQLLDYLQPNGMALLNFDTPETASLVNRAHSAGAKTVMTFGEAKGADFRLLDWEVTDDFKGLATVDLAGEQLKLQLGAPGRAVALNALSALGALRMLEIDVEPALAQLENFTPGSHTATMEWLPVGHGKALLIDDTRNAADLSMAAAFQLAARVARNSNGRVVAVVGEIVNLGDTAAEVHGNLATPLREAGVDAVFTHGSDMEELINRLGPKHQGYASSPEELAPLVWKEIQPNDVVVVKGSHRNTGFRKVPKLISALAHD